MYCAKYCWQSTYKSFPHKHARCHSFFQICVFTKPDLGIWTGAEQYNSKTKSPARYPLHHYTVNFFIILVYVDKLWYEQFSNIPTLYAPVTLTLPIIRSYTNFNIEMSQNFHFFRILGSVDKLWYEQFSDIPTLYVPVALTLPITQSYTKLSTQISENV